VLDQHGSVRAGTVAQGPRLGLPNPVGRLKNTPNHLDRVQFVLSELVCGRHLDAEIDGEAQ
jgi:hypothetical protein